MILFYPIWDDDHVLGIDEHNWKCLWCTKKTQGFNATKALSHVLGKKDMHIKCYYTYMDKYGITRYQYLKDFKQAWKGVLNYYSDNIKASISSF